MNWNADSIASTIGITRANRVIPLNPSLVVNSFLVKVASRCNLSCDYCYMYQHADQSWRMQPKVISQETVLKLAERLSRYVQDTNLEDITVVLHGGEPLLAGPVVIESLFLVLREQVGRYCKVHLSIQTNGTLLNDLWLSLFIKYDVTMSLSLDGDREASDRHRLKHNGDSSYDQVISGLTCVKQNPTAMSLLTGVLAVIDTRNDPLVVYESLVTTGVPSIDFLLPDGTYEAVPPFLTHPGVKEEVSPYGPWLARIFDRWYSTESKVRIRFFENIMDLCLGGMSRTEGIGPGCFSIITIETNGEIQDVDFLKVTYEGASRLGQPYSVHTHDIAEVLEADEVIARNQLLGKQGLCKTCSTCELADTCAGGHLAHRYKSENGFDNPSIYCGDLAYLIGHIRSTIARDLELAKLA